MTWQLSPWADYVDLLKPAEELDTLTWNPQDEQLRAELYRQLAMNLSLGYFLYFNADPLFPDFSPFLNSVYLLQPNPDDVYLIASVDAAHSYRITGERGSVRLLNGVTGRNMMGTSPEPGEGLSEFDFDDLEIDANGRFEVIFSSERPAGHDGNWLALPPRANYIMVRQRSYDWGVEYEARLSIERVAADMGALRPKMPAAEIDTRLRELFGGFTERLSRMWLSHHQALRKRLAANVIEFHNFAGGLTKQAYWQAHFELNDDEALILETELPEQHRYWNVQLNDPLFNALEYVHRQSSLNGHQARIDSDGKFRAVLALQDPGVANWLDVCGNRQGSIIGRWFECNRYPLPTLTRVPLARLDEHLPIDTQRVTVEQRRETLRNRRIGAQLRRRW